MREKLRIFPFISLETSFSWLSDDIVRFNSKWGLWRNVQKCQHRFRWVFPHDATARRRYWWRHYHWQATRLLCKYIGRCLCERVDVYIITLSCTWRIYALSERLLVIFDLKKLLSTDSQRAYFAPRDISGRPIVMSKFYVCLSVCLSARISRKPHGRTSPNCLYTVVVARSFYGSIPIRYVLPVLWITLCFSHTVVL